MSEHKSNINESSVFKLMSEVSGSSEMLLFMWLCCADLEWKNYSLGGESLTFMVSFSLKAVGFQVGSVFVQVRIAADVCLH